MCGHGKLLGSFFSGIAVFAALVVKQLYAEVVPRPSASHAKRSTFNVQR